MNDLRASIGEAGELIAARFLEQHGMTVVGRNIEVDGGELDLLAVDGNRRVVVEVRTITGPGDPIDAIGDPKRQHVRRLSSTIRAARTDLVGVALREWGLEIHWVPG